MTDLEGRTRQDGEADSDIRALLRESDYSGRLRDDFKRNLLRELNHNFDYHRMRTRVLVSAVVVLGVGAALWRASEVGSDGFELKPTGRAVEGDPIVEAPMTGMRFNAPAVGGSTDEGIAVAQDVYEQIEAGVAEVLRVETWTFDGETTQMTLLEVDRAGEREQVMLTSGDSMRFPGQRQAFLAGPGRATLEAIERGEKGPERTESMRYRERDFKMGVWTWDTAEFGTVVYKRSLP